MSSVQYTFPGERSFALSFHLFPVWLPSLPLFIWKGVEAPGLLAGQHCLGLEIGLDSTVQ